MDPEVRYTIWAGVLGGVALNMYCHAGDLAKSEGLCSLLTHKKPTTGPRYVISSIILGVGLALVLFYSDLPTRGIH